MSADVREVARRALALAGGEEVQITVTGGSVRIHRLSEDTSAPSVSADDFVTVVVHVLRDGHSGITATRETTDAELQAAIDAATAAAADAAAAAGGSGPHPGLPAPQPVRAHDGYDPATARHEPEPSDEAIAIVRRAARDAGFLVEATWTTRATETAITSSAGIDLFDRTTSAQLYILVRDPGMVRSSSTSAIAVRASDIDAAEVVTRALWFLRLGERSVVAPGPLPVVLSSEAVAAVLAELGTTAFDGLAHAEGRGTLVGRLGSRVAASAINLADAPRFPRTLPAAFDCEGVPKAPVPLIQDGVAHRVVHDLRSAALAGTTSTGHAQDPINGGGPRAQHLVLSGGGAADITELCAPIAEGLFINSLQFEHSLPTTVFTLEGALRIENGRVTGPTGNVRLAADPLAVLAGVEALTTAQRLVLVPGATVVAPALRTNAITVIGPA